MRRSGFAGSCRGRWGSRRIRRVRRWFVFLYRDAILSEQFSDALVLFLDCDRAEIAEDSRADLLRELASGADLLFLLLKLLLLCLRLLLLGLNLLLFRLQIALQRLIGGVRKEQPDAQDHAQRCRDGGKNACQFHRLGALSPMVSRSVKAQWRGARIPSRPGGRADFAAGLAFHETDRKDAL